MMHSMPELDEPLLASSPSRRRSPRQSQKPKKPPPITPRRFTKFFTPRPVNGRQDVKTSRKALRRLRGPALNQRANTRTYYGHQGDLENIGEEQGPRGRKRKLSTPAQSSVQSSPIKRPVFFLPSSQEIPDESTEGIVVGSRSPSKMQEVSVGTMEDEDENDEETETDIENEDVLPAPAVRRYQTASTSANLLFSRLNGGRTKTAAVHSVEWQDDTGNFYTSSTDVHHNNGINNTHMALPFCVRSCHKNSLVATGDEEGSIRLLDSDPAVGKGFRKAYLFMKPHSNAVMDMTFSENDDYLATACGDQTSQIIDVRRQESIHTLRGHVSTLKAVLFQPGSGSKVVVSGARDGNINIYDLRCPASTVPAANLHTGEMKHNVQTPTGRIVNQIKGAHANTRERQADVRSPPNGRYKHSSVTSLAFLPDLSRNHLLVSASEADATVKLWDMRTTYSNRRPRPVPVSTTDEPPSHKIHRRFGLTSIAFSADGSRLYSLCRDHTVYAYSTSHLVLGDAPEMSSAGSQPRRPGGSERPGLGPLFGLRHPKLRVLTFFIKLDIRAAVLDGPGAGPELLAIGSSDSCAIVIPTNERHLTSSNRYQPHAVVGPDSVNPFSNAQPFTRQPCRPTSLQRANSDLNPSFNQQEDGGVRIYTHGTPLIRGHNKEVTAVSWNYNGSLSTVSDDLMIRCWREDREKARQLRSMEEFGGGRWRSGWADVSVEGYDN